MTPLPPPSIPWQLTGNHWLALPCIHPADASVHALGLLHRGSRAAVEVAGSADFLGGAAPPLLQPMLEMGGRRHELSSVPIAWERAFGWIPTFTCVVGEVVVRGTVFAPYGRDVDMPGAVYAVTLENRGASPLDVAVTMRGTWGHRQVRVRSPRTVTEPSRLSLVAGAAVLMDGSATGDLPAVAIAMEDDAATDDRITVEGDRFEWRRPLVVPVGGRVQAVWYLACGPERDGAMAIAATLRRRGWRDLLSATRDALRALEQSSGSDAIDRLINRNLLFAYFYAVGRAMDDAHYYLVRSRAPWHGAGVTVRDWEALMWTVPAVQLADPHLARELILRVCELHGYAPGRGVNYFDGTLFEPGFSVDGLGAYALATERYIRDTGDDRIVDEPALADTLYLSAEDLAGRRDKNVPLYSTEVTTAGAPSAHPFTVHGNAVVALALDVLRRTLDEETATHVEDPEAVRAALRRHFLVDRGGKQAFASSIDLSGGVATDDDPGGSALWLPFYEAVPREDSTYRRTVKGLGREPHLLVLQCARLLGPESSSVLQWLRRAPLDGGMAAEMVDGDGRAEGNGGDASLSGLLAWTAWYAVHALGEKG